MNMTEIFIRRPALTIVLSLMITIIGIMSFRNLPLRWIPNIKPPVVSVETFYSGASPNLIESQITTPVENSLTGVDGVESISSSSKQGVSNITLTFKMGHNINTAIEDVRSAIQTAVESFPKDVKPPLVEKTDLNGQPIIYIAFSDAHRSDKEVSNYVKQFIMPQLQSAEGVSAVQTYGERTFAMRVWLDPMKMAAANVAVEDLTQALNQQYLGNADRLSKGQS